ncbi:hypothetical protein B0H34DRAFT_716930 [Crassisporium funariophilum]|nr:hypothetical protein B0H34DRAFT_716930 [Crassisporium funariophilum]
MAHRSTHIGEPRRRLWSCDDNYRFPIPKPTDDPWNVCLEPLLQEDSIRCDAWRDEIQNLLIFAGLFSAVVTAFTLESYKSLQPDSGEATVLLLTRIAARLDNAVANASTAESIYLPMPTSAFSVPPSSIRINILWFFSLVLSLATVLIGIVCMQWLREYQRYSSDLEPKKRFAQRNMRFEGLKKWHVPMILTGLPLVLQTALVLFFIGVIEFLWALDHRVAIPVSAVIGCVFVFLLSTTTLSGLQSLWSPYDSLGSRCPYKSPQAWAFLELTRLIKNGLLKLVNSPPFKRVFRSLRFRKVPLFQGTNWISFDLHWLAGRDQYFNRANASQFISMLRYANPGFDYDAACGIIDVLERHSRDKAVIQALYHASSDMKGATMQAVLEWRIPEGSQPFRRDVRAYLFLVDLVRKTRDVKSVSNIWAHQLELFIRMNNYAVVEGRRAFDVMPYGQNAFFPPMLPHDFAHIPSAVQYQLILTFRASFEVLITQLDTFDLKDLSQMFFQFVQVIRILMSNTRPAQNTEVEREIVSLNHLLLDRMTIPRHQLQADLLYQLITLYVTKTIGKLNTYESWPRTKFVDYPDLLESFTSLVQCLWERPGAPYWDSVIMLKHMGRNWFSLMPIELREELELRNRRVADVAEPWTRLVRVVEEPCAERSSSPVQKPRRYAPNSEGDCRDLGQNFADDKGMDVGSGERQTSISRTSSTCVGSYSCGECSSGEMIYDLSV